MMVLAAQLSALLFVFLLIFLLREAAPAWNNPGAQALLQDDAWFPSSGQFGMMPMLLATLVTTAGALLLAVPVGISASVFSNFFAAPWLAPIFRRLVELLAGIPSVVFGLWGLLVLVPAIAQNFGGPGQSLLAAILVLALMILPTVALTADAALRATPSELLFGAHALGFSRSAIVRRVVLPAAQRGIRSGVFLALARGVGETMAIAMVAGNKVQKPYDLLLPVRTLSANIALELGYAGTTHRATLFAGGLLLVVFITVALILAHTLPWPRHAALGVAERAR
jgi:phosphate transport system permease protein